jgi:hypothetical protein
MHKNLQMQHKYLLYHEKSMNLPQPQPQTTRHFQLLVSPHYLSSGFQAFNFDTNAIYSSNSDFLLLFMSCICWLNFCCSSNLFSFLLFHSATNTSIQNINVSSCTKKTMEKKKFQE